MAPTFRLFSQSTSFVKFNSQTLNYNFPLNLTSKQQHTTGSSLDTVAGRESFVGLSVGLLSLSVTRAELRLATTVTLDYVQWFLWRSRDELK